MDVPGVACDACTLLNLIATDRPEEILPAYGCPCFIVKAVQSAETLYLRALPEDDPAQSIYKVDLSILGEKGVLTAVELTEQEQITYVAYARDIDDGEAQTAALAVHRGLWLATDDGKARRFAESKAIQLLRTSEWVKRWAEKDGIGPGAIRDALRQIEFKARFRPNSKDPLYTWWRNLYAGSM